ncbi:23S rRNA (guanine(745)-N(1))-methyltransferase [Halioxenophilus aromaticivorans]
MQLVERRLVCSQNHSFDLARQGYVNLLPANFKHSKAPGDDKSMLQARRDFLNAGFYKPLQDALVQIQSEVRAALGRGITALDMGGGDGYFSAALTDDQHRWFVSDISKDAVRLAAGRFGVAQCSVASSFKLPLADNSVDLVLRNFAPSSEPEVARVLRRDGFYCVVTPNDDHLIELRRCLYQQPKSHTAGAIEGLFQPLWTRQVSYSFDLTSKDHRQALLAMTPMAWRANLEQKQRWLDAEAVSVTANFTLALYQVAA